MPPFADADFRAAAMLAVSVLADPVGAATASAAIPVAA
jgi:hypothetical protein